MLRRGDAKVSVVPLSRCKVSSVSVGGYKEEPGRIWDEILGLGGLSALCLLIAGFPPSSTI